MYGFKRACPFEFVEGGFGPGPSKIPKEDTAAIYEATLQKLRLGARAAATASSPSPAASGGLPHSNPVLKSTEPEQKQQQHLSYQHWYCSITPESEIEGNEPSNSSDAPMCDVTSTEVSSASEGTSFSEKDLLLPRISSCGRSCYVCLFRASSSACSHCSRECCEGCCRRCERCQELFCSVCSTVDYEQRYDRSFCLDCGARASSTQAMSVFRPSDAYLMECT